MTGWKEGMRKVALTKLQVETLGLSLKESKENVDCLLDGDEVAIEAVSAAATKFIEEAKKIGVLCELAVRHRV